MTYINAHYNNYNQNASQTERADKNQVKNNAGGYSFQVTPMEALKRFLILGSEGGSYYAKERKLTVENCERIAKLIRDDGRAVVDMVVEISKGGRAPKNTPALFVLAMCMSPDFADTPTRSYACSKVNEVARIGTHIFQFAEFLKSVRKGRGKLFKRAFTNWYNNKTGDQIAYQAVKYKQREGWSHRDLLRLAKPTPKSGIHDAVFEWITKEETSKATPRIIKGYVKVQKAKTVEKVVKLIEKYGLTHEMLPTQFKKDPLVWETLLPKMPLGALVRNLGNMGKLGLLIPFGKWSEMVVEKLGNEEHIKKSRLHPIALLNASKVYGSGSSIKGSGTWTVNQDIVVALEKAFELAFVNVIPSGKRTMLALDVSGSMGWSNCSGTLFTPRDGSAAMAKITLATEPKVLVTAFSSRMVPIDIRKTDSLTGVINKVSRVPMGGTDCALPMKFAMENKLLIDTFVIYTDSETWSGSTHAHNALKAYRRDSGIKNAKLIVVAMVSSSHTIADPSDPYMLDVVGFDTVTPSVIAEFSRD